MARAIGIDLGTTNSAAAVTTAGEPEIIDNAEGQKITPSVVAVNPDDGQRTVGGAARRRAAMNPENTIYSAKRFIGRRFDDEAVQTDKDLVPFKVEQLPNGDAGIFFDGVVRWPADISAMVLRKLKEDAEAELGEEITQAVITVPAYFSDAQREATRIAGEIAGLQVLRVIPEPTAAALAFGLDKSEELTVAVYDLGGGTFDVTILQIGEGVIEVLSTAGDTHLGGDDFDRRIIDWMVESFERKEKVDLRAVADRTTTQRLRDEAERAKIELSSQKSVKINLPFLVADESGPKNLEATLARANLEKLTGDLVDLTSEPTMDALEQAKKTIDDIDEVLLVGGMTRMPLVQEHVKQIFDQEPNRSVNPDEVVALGAALQAEIMQQGSQVKDMLLLDVTPLGLGFEVVGGIMSEVIPRNTTIPVERTTTVYTVHDGQAAIRVSVFQGERGMADKNMLLGGFTLKGILPAPRGVASLQVTFSIDANGILTVTAEDPATQKKEQVMIDHRSGIPPEEVARLVREAEEYAAEDRTRREAAESNNDADQLVYETKKTLETVEEKGIVIRDDVRKDVLAKMRTVLSMLDARPRDAEALRNATAALRKAALEIGVDAYGRGRSNGR